MSFEVFDTSLLVFSGSSGLPLMSAEMLQIAQSEDATLVIPVLAGNECGCGGQRRNEGEAAIAPGHGRGLAGIDPQAVVFDLMIERGGGFEASNQADTALRSSASWQSIFVEVGGDSLEFDAVDDKDLGVVAMSTEPSDGNYVDENGNGQWDEGEEIIVTGTKPRTVDDDPWEGDPGGDVGGDDGGGGVGGGDLPGDTPCVDQKPSGVDLNQLNDMARVAAQKLIDLADSTGWEWGIIIFRGTDGLLHQSQAFTAKHPDELTGATTSLPSGAVIVGYLHTHPIDPDSDQRNLSPADNEFIDDLLALSGNITADPNMLAYIVTKDKVDGYFDNYQTYVYDRSEWDDEDPGCTL